MNLEGVMVSSANQSARDLHLRFAGSSRKTRSTKASSSAYLIGTGQMKTESSQSDIPFCYLQRVSLLCFYLAQAICHLHWTEVFLVGGLFISLAKTYYLLQTSVMTRLLKR